MLSCGQLVKSATGISVCDFDRPEIEQHVTRAGTTLRVEILAERRGSELRIDVTAEADNVHVHTYLDGVQAIDRTYKAPRRGDVDLLGEALETGGKDPVAVETIRKAAQLVGHGHID